MSKDSLFVLDGHTHHGFPNLNKDSIESEMTYLKNLGYDAIVYQLPQNRTRRELLTAKTIEENIEKIKDLASQSNRFHIVNNMSEIHNFTKNNEITCSFSIEYFYGVFDEELTILPKLKNLGIEYITLINSDNDKLFEKSKEKFCLTQFGKNVIKKMNEVDIKIDISHLNESEMIEVINYSNSPVLASHSNIRGIAPLSYNLSDEVLMAMKKKDGLVMLSFNTNGVFSDKNQQENAIAKFADHLDYLKNTVGIDHIGIGTDLQAYGKYVPSELNKPDTFIKLKDVMLSRNYSYDEIEKVFFKNYLNFTK